MRGVAAVADDRVTLAERNPRGARQLLHDADRVVFMGERVAPGAQLDRIVRDARERGYTAVQTISRWESVQCGEARNIFPYQENADVMFNSALVYELSALEPLAEPILRQVPHSTPEYIEAKRLLAFLEWFLPVEKDLIPDDSIIREFIGGSILKDFTIWKA